MPHYVLREQKKAFSVVFYIEKFHVLKFIFFEIGFPGALRNESRYFSPVRHPREANLA